MTGILIYPRGSVLVFTSGEYSDFSMRGHIIAATDLDLPLLARQFALEERAMVAKETILGEDMADFSGWLVSRGLALPLEISVVHLGSYPDWEPEFCVPNRHSDEE